MPVKIKPISVIRSRLNLEPGGKVEKFFTNTCYKHMDKYVPKDKGNLRINVEIGNDYIKYNQLYARYQYKGMREDGTRKVRHYTTPGTGTYWDRKMVSAEMGEVTKEVQKYVEGRK